MEGWPTLSEVNEQELFERFQQTRDPKDRDPLVAHFSWLAEHLARRFDRRGEPLEDLKQVAYFALILSLDRFDPSLNKEFKSYATATILGEIKKHFRDRAWPLRIPRKARGFSKNFSRTAEELGKKLGRNPTYSEIAEALEMPVEEVMEYLEMSQNYVLVSLNQVTGDFKNTMMDQVPEEQDPIEELVSQMGVDELVSVLDDIEKQVITWKYYEQVSQAEISRRLGVNQMMTSRLHEKAIKKLRQAFTGQQGKPTAPPTV